MEKIKSFCCIFFRIDFPFLVLLISGGHCLLAIVQDISDFLLLGSGLDDSPGDAFDKVEVFCIFVICSYDVMFPL